MPIANAPPQISTCADAVDRLFITAFVLVFVLIYGSSYEFI